MKKPWANFHEIWRIHRIWTREKSATFWTARVKWLAHLPFVDSPVVDPLKTKQKLGKTVAAQCGKCTR